MRATDAVWVAGVALAILGGCVTNPAPVPMPPANVAATEAYGGWVTVRPAGGRTGGSRADVAGELIAVHPDSVFVLTDSALVGLPRGQTRKATLFAYDSRAGSLAAWGFLGTLSTVSNGYFLVLTAPLWIITSSVATAHQSRAPMVETSDSAGWDRLRLFARFPQGIPPTLDRTILKPVAVFKAPAAGSPTMR